MVMTLWRDSLLVAHDLNTVVGPKSNCRRTPFDRVMVLRVINMMMVILMVVISVMTMVRTHWWTYMLAGVHDQLAFDRSHPILLMLRRQQKFSMAMDDMSVSITNGKSTSISTGSPPSPCISTVATSLPTCGKSLRLAIMRAYMFDTLPPGARMESPLLNLNYQ